MPDRDPKIVTSSLSRTVTIDTVTVEVQIYRLENEAGWTLEVVNEHGTSTVWDDPFNTDRQAFEAFELAVREEGIATFLDAGDAPTLH